MIKRVGYKGLKYERLEKIPPGALMVHDEIIMPVDYAQKIDLKETDAELQKRLAYIGEKTFAAGDKLDALAARYGLQRRDYAKLLIDIDPAAPKNSLYSVYDGVVHRIKDLA